MRETYKTIKSEGTAEIVEKKSRFIANVKRVSSDEEAMDFYEIIKKKYWDARHNVFAYYIGGNSFIQKFTDEGEPAGTAGMPILDVIKKQGLEDIIVVVTRYFGGILLGTGGLVRAYSKSAIEAIKSTGIVEKVWSTKIHMKIDYTFLGKIQTIANNEGWYIIDTIYADLIDIYLAVPIKQVNLLNKKVSELSAGSIEVNEIDNGYYIIKEV
ncbi:MAG: YigZ family protein [Ignavibacteriales bacterium]